MTPRHLCTPLRETVPKGPLKGLTRWPGCSIHSPTTGVPTTRLYLCYKFITILYLSPPHFMGVCWIYRCSWFFFSPTHPPPCDLPWKTYHIIQRPIASFTHPEPTIGVRPSDCLPPKPSLLMPRKCYLSFGVNNLHYAAKRGLCPP